MSDTKPDPCSSGEYLKKKLGSMPLVGNLSLEDMLPDGGLGGVTNPTFPKPKDIGKEIGEGIKEGLSELHPAKLGAKLKAEAGKRLRVKLSDKLNDEISDILGPMGDSIGDKILYQAKGNLLMFGLDEVANVIAGEPNVFNPCGKNSKQKTEEKVNKAIDTAKSASANTDINKSITEALEKPENQTNQMKRDLIKPVDIPTGNGFEASTDPEKTKAAEEKHAEAVASVKKDAEEIVVKKTKEKIVREEKASEKGDIKAFIPLAPSSSTTQAFHVFYREKSEEVNGQLMTWDNMTTEDKIHYLNNRIGSPELEKAILENPSENLGDSSGEEGSHLFTFITGWTSTHTSAPGTGLPERYTVGSCRIRQFTHVEDSEGNIVSSTLELDTEQSYPLPPDLDKMMTFTGHVDFNNINRKKEWGIPDNFNRYVHDSLDAAAAIISGNVFMEEYLTHVITAGTPSKET